MRTPVKSHPPGTWTSPAATAIFWAAMDEHARVLAQRIEHARKAKGWSKGRLALEAGLSEKTIKRLEKAEIKKPQAETYDKLAAALGVEVRHLDEGRPTLDELEAQDGPLERMEAKLEHLTDLVIELSAREEVPPKRKRKTGT